MKPDEVAAAMGIGLRTYEEFEAGRGRLDLEKVRLFGLATDSDAVAITLGLLFGSRETAMRSLNHKAPTILWMTWHEFEDGTGDQVAVIPGVHFLETFRQAFARLREFLLKRENQAERFLEDQIRRLYAPTDAPDDGSEPSGGS